MVRINSIQKNEDGTFRALVQKSGELEVTLTGISGVGNLASIKFEDPNYRTRATVVTQYGIIRTLAKCACGDEWASEGVCECSSFSFSDEQGKIIEFK